MKLLLFGILPILLIGCSTGQIAPISKQLPGLPAYPPPAIFARQGSKALTQLITISSKEGRQSFTAIVEVDADRATVAGFGAFGVRLFLLTWGPEGDSYSANPTFSPLLDPRTIYSDMQFALMSLDDRQLLNHPLAVTPISSRERVVRIDGVEKLIVSYQSNDFEHSRFSLVYPNSSLRVSVQSEMSGDN